MHAARPPQTYRGLSQAALTQGAAALVFTGSSRRTESFFIEFTSLLRKD